MAKTIVIVGTLDTKGDQIEYLLGLIKEKGHKTMVIDVGVLGDIPFDPDISRDEVAKAANTTIDDIIGLGHESKGMAKMTEGAKILIDKLNQEGKIDSVFALGGSMGTALALEMMEVLPLDMPKVILSTIANSPAIDSDFLANNVIMMPWFGGLWGFNEIARIALDQAAGLITGMAEAYEKDRVKDKKIVGITSLGMAAARYLYHLRPALIEKGYEIAAFHATGMSSRLFEKAIKDGRFDFVLDLFAGEEIINEIGGSLFSPGKKRLDAAAKKGVPQIVSLGTPEVILWGTSKEIPEHLQTRDIVPHNPLLWIIFTTKEEKLEMARILVEKLNKSTGPTAVILPLKFGFALTKYGNPEYISYDDYAEVRREIKNNLKPGITYIEVDASNDDKEFSDAVMSQMDKMI